MQLPDINDLIQDLQLAKQIAIEDRNPNALIMATIGQAKLLGIDKAMHDVTPHSNIKSGIGHFYGNKEPEPIANKFNGDAQAAALAYQDIMKVK